MRPYGYTTVLRSSLDQAECDRANAAATEFLDNDRSLESLCSEWDARGYSTVTGRRWTGPAFRRMFLNPHNAGLNPDGSPAPWPALFTLETHRRLVEKLTDPARSTGGPQADGRAYLMTGGKSRCRLCGHRLVPSPVAPGRRSYVCSSAKRSGGCGKIRVSAAPLDDFIGHQVVAVIVADGQEHGRLAAAQQRLRDHAADTRTRLSAAEQALAQIAVEYAANPDLKVAYVTLAAHVGQLQAESRELDRLAAITVPSGVDEIVEWWNRASVADRFAVVDVLIDHIEVGPGTRGSHVFDPGRVTIAWR